MVALGLHLDHASGLSFIWPTSVWESGRSHVERIDLLSFFTKSNCNHNHVKNGRAHGCKGHSPPLPELVYKPLHVVSLINKCVGLGNQLLRGEIEVAAQILQAGNAHQLHGGLGIIPSCILLMGELPCHGGDRREG